MIFAYRQKQTGFTLLEIMVAVSIIAMLSAILYTSFDGARKTARNKAMMTEIKEVQLALEVYKAQNGSYPLPETAGLCGSGGPTGIASTESTCSVAFITNLSPDFIAALPDADDSSNSDCELEYRTDSGGSWYKLTAINCLAGDMTLDQNDEMARCPSSCLASGRCDPADVDDPAWFPTSFAVYSLGGQCS